MSGDVQPRKRKEKRRKKDDEDTGTPPPTLISPTDTSTENVTIHIYKESSTGGHWCARIIFFILLAVLVGLIGIIIFEHRGTTDVDTPIESSRWASIFEGWVDDSPPRHDDVSHEELVEESKEVEEEEEEEKEDNNEEESTETEKQEEEKRENIEQEEDEGIGAEEENEDVEEEEEEEEGEIEEEETEEIEEEGGEEENQEEEEETEGTANEDENEDEDIDEENSDEEEANKAQEYDDSGTLEETDETNGYEDETDEGIDNFDVELEASMEIDNSAEKKDNDISEEFADIPGIHEIDDNSAEPLEEIESEGDEEDLNDIDSEPEEEEEEIEEESTSVAVKFGVGVALVVAAHFVLVRRWNNVNTSHSPHDTIDIPDLSRRKTIVPPPHIKQVIKSVENVENKAPVGVQVKNYEDLRFKYMGELQEENISLMEINSSIPKDKAPQVNEKWSTQNTAKTEIDTTNQDQFKIISSEEEDYELETSESEHVSGMEEYDEEQMEENNEEGEEEEEEDEEIENVDDSELIAKLEAKYGKLSTLQDSEAEEEDEDEDEEEEEEEKEEEEEEEEEAEEEDEKEEKKDTKILERKRVKALKDSHMESEAKISVQQTRVEINQVDSDQLKSGGKAYDFNNIWNIDDIVAYEENNSTDS
ncbi:uncharacterized protein [Anoplolepis gracilipes]|uniref:uncharacterized protein n=1 Tax=Anoplolepis gracilipes TaxID=354296 RepID=UPI003BA0AEA5